MEKQEVESPAAWRPEPGKTAWTMMGNTCQEVEVTGKSEQDFAGLNNVMIRVPNFGERGTMEDLLFPTAEAALASIKIYDLSGVEVPRLEPSELQWVSNALGEWAYHGDWIFRAGYDGTWYANYKDRYVDGIGTMHERETSVEYAKAAIHEWRVNHLKSMTA